MKLPVSYGNSKLNGNNVVIFNITPAAACESDRLGLCTLGPKTGDGTCYAWRHAERIRPNVLAYRERQTEWWDYHFDPEAFVRALRKTTKYFRFSEAGDFRNQEDVDKMMLVCKTLKEHGIKCYGYTKRHDLQLIQLSWYSYIVVGDVLLEGFACARVIEKDEKPDKGWIVCPVKGCLTKCFACANGKKNKIAFRRH